MRIELENVSKTFPAAAGSGVEALRHVSLQVRSGEFVCVLGPSGCGKSTLLKLIAGIESADTGSIVCGGVPVHAPSAERGFIFQDYALFPWLTVRQNIAFGLKLQGVVKAKRERITDECIKLMGLTGSERLYPSQLSGGMRQRVALARALCLKPKVLLMDEPFAALDALMRQKLQDELQSIRQSERITYVLVTHDVEEAVYLADRIVIMEAAPGRIAADVPVTLPHPRERVSMEFVQLRQHIHGLLGHLKVKESQEAQV